jgi:hypothetical protein
LLRFSNKWIPSLPAGRDGPAGLGIHLFENSELRTWEKCPFLVLDGFLVPIEGDQGIVLSFSNQWIPSLPAGRCDSPMAFYWQKETIQDKKGALLPSVP